MLELHPHTVLDPRPTLATNQWATYAVASPQRLRNTPQLSTYFEIASPSPAPLKPLPCIKRPSRQPRWDPFSNRHPGLPS